MKIKLLALALFGTLGINAQTTHMVDWFMGVSSAETTITIDEGDTVIWTWMDNLPHTVTSTGGTDTFNSGTKTGMGQTYTRVFNNVGATNYHCNVHGMMSGTITVEAVMGVEDNVLAGLQYYPNPVNDIFTLTSSENIDRVEVYDINGRMLMLSDSPNPIIKIYMENFNSGTYFVKATMGNESKNITIVKQ
jgi:hypothetical protein